MYECRIPKIATLVKPPFKTRMPFAFIQPFFEIILIRVKRNILTHVNDLALVSPDLTHCEQ